MSRLAGLLFWLMIIAGIATIAPCLILPAWADYQAALEQVATHENQLAALEAHLKAQEKQIEHLKDDPSYIERIARDELNMPRPGVAAIVVEQANPNAGAGDAAGTGSRSAAADGRASPAADGEPDAARVRTFAGRDGGGQVQNAESGTGGARTPAGATPSGAARTPGGAMSIGGARPSGEATPAGGAGRSSSETTTPGGVGQPAEIIPHLTDVVTTGMRLYPDWMRLFTMDSTRPVMLGLGVGLIVAAALLLGPRARRPAGKLARVVHRGPTIISD